MALTDLDEYLDLLNTPYPVHYLPGYISAGLVQNFSQGSTVRWRDFWLYHKSELATPPSTAVALSRTSAVKNYADIPDLSSGQSMYMLGARVQGGEQNTLLIVDRLSHQGSLSGTTTGAQTTNLPTAALTRYTSGEGVHAALTIWNALGTNTTTVTASYTNQAGTSGQTTPAIAFTSGTGNGAPGMLHPLPLQEGDTGVRSVESVTLSGSTGSAGNFGVVLYKPLALIYSPLGKEFDVDWFSGRMGALIPEIDKEAYLSAFVLVTSSAEAQTQYSFTFRMGVK